MSEDASNLLKQNNCVMCLGLFTITAATIQTSLKQAQGIFDGGDEAHHP